MSVYVIVDNEVHDPEPYAEYLRLVTPTVAKYGGRYKVRAGHIHFADSDWEPDRLVVIEFDDVDAARRWVDAEDVAEIHAMRRRHARSRLIIIDGVDEATQGA
ncbi:MAG: DUF1330 domain-containing protein [Halieaceae bacterium]|jgi:uncharacterized protein (DUF1330 family)|nr:DUF1330 domain-containing protein [Halieaceae bacterium]